MDTQTNQKAGAAQDSQVACLLPFFLELGTTLTDINAKLEESLGKVNKAIAVCEELDPTYPALPVLRAKRKELLRFQTALLQTEQHFQDEAIAMEDGYAASLKPEAMSVPEGLEWLFKKS
jgi:hypothetical protein